MIGLGRVNKKRGIPHLEWPNLIAVQKLNDKAMPTLEKEELSELTHYKYQKAEISADPWEMFAVSPGQSGRKAPAHRRA